MKEIETIECYYKKGSFNCILGWMATAKGIPFPKHSLMASIIQAPSVSDFADALCKAYHLRLDDLQKLQRLNDGFRLDELNMVLERLQIGQSN